MTHDASLMTHNSSLLLPLISSFSLRVSFTPRLQPGDPQTMKTSAAVSTAFAQTKKETIETAIILTHQAAGAFQCKRELRSSVIAKPKARIGESRVGRCFFPSREAATES